MMSVGFYNGNMYLNPIYSPARVSAITGVDSVHSADPLTENHKVKESQGVEKTKECQTCKNRKYLDGSDESDVSFKTPGHISPEASRATVMSHEMEHVANARQKTADSNKQLLSASVSLKIGVCPECGKTYVEGGETTSKIKTTYDSNNPYDKARKTIEGSFLSGMNVDLRA